MSSTWNDAVQSIQSRFAATWSTAFAFENEHFTPPESGSYARLWVEETAAGQETLSPTTKSIRRDGHIIVEIFTDLDVGRGPSDDLLEEARAMFETVRFDGLTTFSSERRRIGPSGKRYHVQLETRFQFVERV